MGVCSLGPDKQDRSVSWLPLIRHGDVFSIISSSTVTGPRCKRPEPEVVLVVGFAYGGMLLGITKE
jgi:hypothetical protein